MMGQRRRYASAIALLFCAAIAHAPLKADTGVPLYVAETGADQGDCSNRYAPCRSLGYALGVAGKNARIRVGAGTFAIDDPADALYMVSGALDVSGGHVVGATAPSGTGRSTLTGVPLELRGALRERGFHIIVDSKANERDTDTRRMLERFQHAQAGAAAAPCAGGSADGFACSNVDLLAHVARAAISASPAEAMDIWGFVDFNTHREYVLVGVTVGTAVFDVTDPSDPREVGFVDGQGANWRDIKVYQVFDAAADRWRAYAYVTTDGASDGLFVIDLSGLPQSIRRVAYASDFTSAHNVYLTNTDFATGVRQTSRAPQVIVAGSGIEAGQYRSYSLDNPASPQFVRRVAGAGYMHDAASAILDDARAAQCAGSPASCEVLVDFNEERVEFWEVNDAAAPNLLARAAVYANTGYVHSGWWTEDKQYVFAHDELDERNSGLATTLRVFAMSDLANPNLVGVWTGGTAAIDHNGFVRGNRYYMSNYTRGLTILDITNPAVPIEAGFFDTYGANDNTVFAGAWGAYPFLPSGTIGVSDINSGLYLLADRTRDVAAGSLAFEVSSYAAQEGAQAMLAVSRSGGSAGAASVDLEVLATSADAGDLLLQTTSLSWLDGDAATKTVPIDIVSDAEAEALEHALVRLTNPAGGATLGDVNVANLYLSDAGAASVLSVFTDAVDVAERGFGRAVVVVQRRGDAVGAASIDFAVGAADATANDDYTGPASGTLSWAAGDATPRSIEFAIGDDGQAEADEFFELSFSNAQGAALAGPQTARVTILDGSGANAAPNAVAGSNQTVAEGAQVTLDGSMSNDPDGDTLGFAWSQTGGPAVTLQNANTASASFTAPAVSSDTLLQFRLDVTDPSGLGSFAVANVTVTNGGGGTNPAGGGGGGGAPAPLALLLLMAAAARRSRRTG